MTIWRHIIVAVVFIAVLGQSAFGAIEIRVDSEDGDHVGQGQSYVLTETNGTFEVSNQEMFQVDIAWRNLPTGFFSFKFISFDQSSPLAPGVYENAQRTQTGLPVLDINSFGGCGETSGTFEIHEIEFAGGVLSKLAVDAIQYCDGSPHALRAQLRVNSVVPFDIGPNVETEDDFVVGPGSQIEVSLAQATTTNGAIESYLWTQTSGIPVAISGADTASITFSAPILEAEYEVLVFLVTVTDSQDEAATDAITVIVSENAVPGSRFLLDSPPGSFVGGGQTIESDIDRQYLALSRHFGEVRINYAPPNGIGWHFSVVPPSREELHVGQFGAAFQPAPRPFDKPGLEFGITGRGCSDSVGEFKVLDIGFTESMAIERLAVDAMYLCIGEGEPVDFRIRLDSVVPLFSRAPIADPGPDLIAHDGDTVILDSLATRNDTGQITSFDWRQVGGPAVTLSGADSEIASFLAPDVALGQGLTEFLLTVVNDAGFRDTESTVVNILGSNDPKNIVLLRVDPGTGSDWITDSSGIDLRLDPNGGYLAPANNSQFVAVVFAQFGHWRFEFSPDGDTTIGANGLPPGTYQNARRLQSGFPHLDVSSPGRGCNQTDGEFEVLEYVEDSDGMLESLAVDFTQRCDSGAPLHGILRLNSAAPLQQASTPPPSPPPSPSNPKTSGGGGSTGLILISILCAAYFRRGWSRLGSCASLQA
jgi:K319-like protein